MPSRSVMMLRIRELREALGIPQWQMAEALGISAGYLSLIEHGHRHLRLTMAARIADILDVQPSDLVTIVRRMPAPAARPAAACPSAHGEP